jgi:hypothetical protein
VLPTKEALDNPGVGPRLTSKSPAASRMLRVLVEVFQSFPNHLASPSAAGTPLLPELSRWQALGLSWLQSLPPSTWRRMVTGSAPKRRCWSAMPCRPVPPAQGNGLSWSCGSGLRPSPAQSFSIHFGVSESDALRIIDDAKDSFKPG